MLVLAMVAVAFGSMLQTVSADDSSNTPTITVDGPSKLGIGVKQMYKIVIAGGPAATGPNGTYSWTATMSGKYYSTGKMSSYSGGPTANGTFFVNVTAPTTAGAFYITFKANSTNVTITTPATPYKLTIDVVNPIILKATITNSANVTVKSVPVSFYDGDTTSGTLIYNTTVDVSALSKATVSYNWTSYELSNGKHYITVAIDPNSTFVTLDTGSKTQTLTVYWGASGYENINAWLWAFVVVLAILFFLIYRQPTKYKKKGVKGAGKQPAKKK